MPLAVGYIADSNPMLVYLLTMKFLRSLDPEGPGKILHVLLLPLHHLNSRLEHFVLNLYIIDTFSSSNVGIFMANAFFFFFLGVQVYDYLEQTVASNQTIEIIHKFVEDCEKYDLAKGVMLNIVNIRPSSAVEIDPVIFVKLLLFCCYLNTIVDS